MSADHVIWMTTMPNPRVVSQSADAGQRGWRTHAVSKAEYDKAWARVKAEPGYREGRDYPRRVKAVCGVRAAHGWGHDLFVEEECARCSNIMDKLGACHACRGAGTVVALVPKADNPHLGEYKTVDCKACAGVGFKMAEPERVRLTEDFVDVPTGMAYPKGTVLVRSPHSGQYMLEGTGFGQACVAGFFLIRDICEAIETPED